jgi:hypothetical protein
VTASEDLKRLTELFRDGAITQEEYSEAVRQRMALGDRVPADRLSPRRDREMKYENDYGREVDVPVGRIAAVAGGVVVALLALIFLMSVTWVSVDSSHATLVYNDGLLDDRSFDQVVQPGSSKTPVGIAQNSFEVPIGVRQWRASNDENSGADYKSTIPVTVRGVNMGFEPTILFKLNLATMPDSSKPWVADFYEKHLRQFGATDWDSTDPNSKWVGFLNTRIYPVVKQVMQSQLTGMDPVALRFDTDGARTKAADDLAPAIAKEIEAQLGGPYLTDITVQLSQPEVDQAVADMLGAPQKAKVEADNKINAAAEQTRQANGLATEAEAQVEAARRKAAADKANADAQAAPQVAQAANQVAACRALNPQMDGTECALLLTAIGGGQLPTSLGGTLVAP